MNYLIARVSQEEQKDALPAQERRLLDYAEKQDWTEKDFTYIAIDETAYKEDRRKFNTEVIEPLKKEKELSIVVFDKIDRLTRDSGSEERHILTKMVKEGRIELHFPYDNLYINQDSPAADIFRLEIGMSLAGYYSNAIRDNVKRRFSQMLEDGIWIGRAPIGYFNYQEYDKNSGKVILKDIRLDPERQHFIRKGFELRSTGLPYKSIAKAMKKAGLRSRTDARVPISASQWEQILNNPFYAGVMVYKGVNYVHNYPRIIDQWLWDNCQEVKNQRSNGKTKHNAKQYLLKNLRCHDCGYSISFEGPKSKGGYIYGKCTEYGGKHGAMRIREDKLMEQIREILSSITIPKKELPWLVAEIEKNHASEQEYYLRNRKRLEKEYEDLDEEVKELFKDRKQFKSRMDIFEKMVKDIELKQKMVLEELKDHSDGDKAFVVGASYILDICSRALELFEAESSKVEQKRYLLDLILQNLTLDGKTLRFNLKMPFDAVALMQKTGEWYPLQDSNLRPSVPKTDTLIR